jgi:hypothetical protein
VSDQAPRFELTRELGDDVPSAGGAGAISGPRESVIDGIDRV